MGAIDYSLPSDDGIHYRGFRLLANSTYSRKFKSFTKKKAVKKDELLEKKGRN